MVTTIRREDKVVTQDGRTLRVMAVKMNGNDIYRVEGINDADPTPIRITLRPEDIRRVIPNVVKEGVKA